MTSLKSMINKLKPLGIYNLGDESLVYAELSAFSAGLDILRDELEELLREAFVKTAESFGIENLERETEKLCGDLSIEKRRSMLINRLSFGSGDFTLSGFQKMLRFLGVSGEIIESPFTLSIALKLQTGEYSEAFGNWIISQAKALFPAHLECDIVFPGLEWQVIDRMQNTFLYMDTKGYSWDKIDYINQKGK